MTKNLTKIFFVLSVSVLSTGFLISAAVAARPIMMPDQSNAIPQNLLQSIPSGYLKKANEVLQRRRNKITQAQREDAAKRREAILNGAGK